jgi:hypothetical protein
VQYWGLGRVSAEHPTLGDYSSLAAEVHERWTQNEAERLRATAPQAAGWEIVIDEEPLPNRRPPQRSSLTLRQTAAGAKRTRANSWGLSLSLLLGSGFCAAILVQIGIVFKDPSWFVSALFLFGSFSVVGVVIVIGLVQNGFFASRTYLFDRPNDAVALNGKRGFALSEINGVRFVEVRRHDATLSHYDLVLSVKRGGQGQEPICLDTTSPGGAVEALREIGRILADFLGCRYELTSRTLPPPSD